MFGGTENIQKDAKISAVMCLLSFFHKELVQFNGCASVLALNIQ